MALYDTKCTNCGTLDQQFKGMPSMGGLPQFEPCPCGGTVQKIYHPPADHSANTFKPRWSDNLSTGADPVYVGTKDEYNRLKAVHGLTEHEPGMSQDKRRHDAERKEKELRTNFNRMFAEVAPS